MSTLDQDLREIALQAVPSAQAHPLWVPSSKALASYLRPIGQSIWFVGNGPFERVQREIDRIVLAQDGEKGGFISLLALGDLHGDLQLPADTLKRLDRLFDQLSAERAAMMLPAERPRALSESNRARRHKINVASLWILALGRPPALYAVARTAVAFQSREAMFGDLHSVATVYEKCEDAKSFMVLAAELP